MTISPPQNTSSPQIADMPPRQRLAWLDCAKGIGIVLVVIGHALGGLIDSHATPPSSGYQRVFAALYVFHMPLFFFLSSLLVLDRMERSAKRFARSMATDIVFPYFLWSSIQLVVIGLSAKLVNTPVSDVPRTILRLPIVSTGQFWFLYALFILHLTTLALGRRMDRVSLVVLGLAAWAIVPAISNWTMLNLAAHEAPWYMFGILVGADPIVRLLVSRRTWFLAIFALLSLIATLIIAGPATTDNWDVVGSAASPNIANYAWSSQFAWLAVLGVVTMIIVAFALDGVPRQIFSFLGRRSMPIYILHVLAVAGSRIILHRIGHIDPLAVLFITVMMGVAAPIIMFEIAARFGITRVLGLGRPS